MRFLAFRALLCLSGLLQKLVCPVDWVSDLTNYIVRDSGSSELKVITRLDANETLENPMIRQLIVNLVQRLPTWRINLINDNEEPKSGTTIDGEPDDQPWIDSPAIFFLLVLESRDMNPIPKLKNLMDAAAEMAIFNYRPKYLVVYVSRTNSDNLEEFFRHAWAKKILDLTILELLKTPEVVGVRPAGPTIHRYNPFKSEYTRLSWSPGAERELFPDKVANMWGYPLRVEAVHVPPFSIVEYGEIDREIRSIRGPSILALSLIAKKLNASLLYINPYSKPPTNRSHFSDLIRTMHSSIERHRIDMQSSLTVSFATTRNATLRTTSIVSDQFCALVPILPATKMPVSTDFFEAYLISFCIVSIFCTVAWAIRLNGACWRPFNVSRVLFGVTVKSKPIANVQRVLFACLLFVSAIYSSNIYTSITNVSLETRGEMEFRTFEDLDVSGLVPIISPFMYEKTFGSVDGPLRNLKKRSVIQHEEMKNCSRFAAAYKNVTCCMLKTSAKIAIARLKRDGRPTLKISTPCFWTDSRAFVIGRGSPYRAKIDEIILRLHRSGIIHKLYTHASEVPENFHGAPYESLNDTEFTTIALRQQLSAIVVFGFSLATFAFLLEIIVHRALKNNSIWLFFSIDRFLHPGHRRDRKAR